VIGKVADREKAFELYDEALMKVMAHIFLMKNVRTSSPFLWETLIRCKSGHRDQVCQSAGNSRTEVRFFLPTTISPRYVPENMPDDHGIR